LESTRRDRINESAAAVTRWLAAATPVLAFSMAAAATLFRQTGIPKVRTIWAEDATVFVGCAYTHPSPAACLFEPYNGWIHLVPRLGAELAALAPPAELPLAIALISAVVTGLAAAVVSIAVRNASGSWAAGVLAGSSVAFVWQAGLEVGGNLTNLPWILLAAAIVVIVASWAGHRVGNVDLVLVVMAGLSTAFAPVLPALGLVGVALRGPRAILIVITGGFAALVQLVVGLTSPRTPPGQVPIDPGDAVGLFNDQVIDHGAFGFIRTPPGWAIVVGIVVIVMIAVIRVVLERRAVAVAVAVATRPRAAREEPGASGAVRPARVTSDPPMAILVTLGLVGTGLATYAVALVLQRVFNPRYTYVAAVLVCSALAFSAALVGRGLTDPRGTHARWIRWAARLALPAAALLLVTGFARSFLIETRASDGPDVVAEYRAAEPACDGGAVSIQLDVSPHSQFHWAIVIPCDKVRASR
jgi:hypothetical protein